MWGLILKDFIQLKRILKAFGAVAAIYLAMAVIQKSDGLLVTIGVIACTISTVNSLAMDEQTKWNEYALTLSFDRTKLVVGKYAMLTIMAAVVSIITMIMDAIFFGVGRNVAEIGVGVIISSLISFSYVLPFIYKFGIEKGRYILIAIGMIPFLLFLIADSVELSLSTEKLSSLVNMIEKAPWLLIAGAIALELISIFISVLICKKKEY